MFKRGEFYAHKNFRDVCIYVTEASSEAGSDHVDLNIVWVLKRNNRALEIDKIKVPRDQFKEWSKHVPGNNSRSMPEPF